MAPTDLALTALANSTVGVLPSELTKQLEAKSRPVKNELEAVVFCASIVCIMCLSFKMDDASILQLREKIVASGGLKNGNFNRTFNERYGEYRDIMRSQSDERARLLLVYGRAVEKITQNSWGAP
jgi:hypothetical protein